MRWFARLPAVEALGSTTVICSDKTRTLTSGDMTVVRVWTSDVDVTLVDEEQKAYQDERLRRILEVAALASRVQGAGLDSGRAPVGDPVDLAVLSVVRRLGIDRGPLLASSPRAVIPFSSERKFMASFHGQNGRIVAYVKGAPYRIVEMSDRLHTGEGDRMFGDRTRDHLLEVNGRLAAEGLRVLGVARGEVTEPTESSLVHLTFAGFVGLMDPPAEGVKEAVALLRQAGLRTVMLTGDQRFTAEAVGRQLGVLDSRMRPLTVGSCAR